MPDWTIRVVEWTRVVSLPTPADWLSLELCGNLPAPLTVSGFIARNAPDGLDITWPMTAGRVRGAPHSACYIRDTAARAALLAAIEKRLRAGAGR